MKNIQPDQNDYCVDCKVDTLLIGEYYMVHLSVWILTGLGQYDGMLCIACLENRIKRTLSIQDFPNVPINTDRLFRSDLLISRMT